MESSDRERRENARRERVDGGADVDYSASVERGHLSGTDTSVRARWRVDVIDRNGESTSGAPDPPAGGTTLVRIRLRNPAPAPQRVSVRNALDGPVLFPRRQGVPEAGWTRSGFVGVVDAESERALGYACPAPIRTPPVELRRASDQDGGDGSDGASDSAAPAAVVRTYGDAAPPTAVAREVARSAGGTAEAETAPQAADDGGVSREPEVVETASEAVETASEAVEMAPEAVETTPKRDTAKTEADPTELDRGAESAPPPAVTTWLDGIEDRVARAEQLDDATVTAATAALTEAGGLEPALDDAARLSNDAAELRELADRASELADRADAVEVSETALRRLA